MSGKKTWQLDLAGQGNAEQDHPHEMFIQVCY